MDRVFETTFIFLFSLCNLDGSGKVLKLLCGVRKEVMFWHESQPAGTITKTKTVNVEWRKVRQR